jgi:hypothetical protein
MCFSAFIMLIEAVYTFILDIRIKDVNRKCIEIFDGITICLFSEVMKCVGLKPTTSNHIGGVKVHTVINVD